MDKLIDNVARELANPSSRRGVMKILGGAMVGLLVGAFKPSSLQAAPPACVPACTGKKSTCCTTGTTPFCVTTGKQCCGNTKCAPTDQCCTTSASPFCAKPDVICCGKKTCKSNETCCNGACCSAKQVCVSGRCQASKLPN